MLESLGTFRLASREGLGNPGHWRQAGDGRMLCWVGNLEVLSWVGSEDRCGIIFGLTVWSVWRTEVAVGGVGQIANWWSLKLMEYLEDRGSLCPVQECIYGSRKYGRGESIEGREKENLLTWLGASGWSEGSVSEAECLLHKKPRWSPDTVTCVPRECRSQGVVGNRCKNQKV